MQQGTISAWLKQPGDELSAGDVMCEIETDKASVGFEFQDDAVLAKILVEAQGPEIKVGQPIALTVEDSAAYEEFLKLSADEQMASVGSASATSPAPADTPAAAAPSPAAPSTTDGVAGTQNKRVSPAARHMIESQNLDITSVVGTARHGLISKSDVVKVRLRNV
jgi:pyruvate dehydrogenase E2 component (dihydrolipoamide acetyltransferase)